MSETEAEHASEPFGLPWSVGPHGAVWCQSLKGGETRPIDIRGWGYLTGKGHGGLGLAYDEAVVIQERWAERIVRAVNDEATLRAKLSTIEAETIERCAAYNDELAAHDHFECEHGAGYMDGRRDASAAIRSLSKPQEVE